MPTMTRTHLHVRRDSQMALGVYPNQHRIEARVRLRALNRRNAVVIGRSSVDAQAERVALITGVRRGPEMVESPDRPRWGVMTIQEAARRTQAFGPFEVRAAVKRGLRVRGLRWVWEGQTWVDKPKVRPPKRCRPVVCVETGVQYDSVSDAAMFLGASRTSMSAAINAGRAFRGMHFEVKPWRTVAAA
jgi:hypothetical protein